MYKEAIHEMDPIKFNLIRSVSAAIFSFIILFILGQTDSLFRIDLSTIIIMAISSSLVLVAGDTLYFIGLRSIGVTKAVPITYSYSILVILLSVIFLNETITSLVFFGTISIIIGVWLVTHKELHPNKKSYSSLFGILASLGTAICWGFGIVLFKLILNNNRKLSACNSGGF